MSIITAVDESVNAMQCGGKGDCQDGAMCLTHDLWHNLSAHIEAYLSNVTLDELLNSNNTQSIAERQEYKALSNKGDRKDHINTINLLGVNPA